MRIGELAQEIGVNTKTIRYYEDIGVLPPPDRAPNGYRDYGGEAVGRLRFVRDAQATGLTLTEIASILDLRGQGEATCHHVLDLLDQHLEDLDRHIETLHRTRDELLALTERAKRLDPADCTDPNRCQTIEAGAHVGAPSGARARHVPSKPHHH
ncbi:MAG: heavy metal-responsive transcriptional regulator [Acidobacteria bacterium]|nr:heavy metal-responsive transcriptional regulator [Acidobacteriota bacterium]